MNILYSKPLDCGHREAVGGSEPAEKGVRPAS